MPKSDRAKFVVLLAVSFGVAIVLVAALKTFTDSDSPLLLSVCWGLGTGSAALVARRIYSDDG
jgi:uncharacterized membrane protein